MAYSSASKKAAMVKGRFQILRESRSQSVIPTVKSRAGMVFISSRGRNSVDVKPVSRFK